MVQVNLLDLDFHRKEAELFRKGILSSLILFHRDELLIARLLADRNGFLLHSAGVIMDGKGFLFVGHSGAGKSTTCRMLKPHAEILCDDVNIVRRYEDGWKLYGFWKHSDLSDLSTSSAKLNGIFFIHQAKENRIERITDPGKIRENLIVTLIKPFVTPDWWEKTLDVLEALIKEVPCYDMMFDLSGDIIPEIKKL